MNLLKNKTVKIFIALNVLILVALIAQSIIKTRQYEEQLYRKYASTRRYFTRNNRTDEEAFRRFVRLGDYSGTTNTLPDADLAWTAQLILDTLPFDDEASIDKRDRIQLLWLDIKRPTENQKRIMLTVADAIVQKWHTDPATTATDKILALTTMKIAKRASQPAFVTAMQADRDPDVQLFARAVVGMKNE